MKLYLIIDYNKSHYDDCEDDCEDSYNTANPAAFTNASMHNHESFQSYSHFVLSCLGSIYRSSYQDYEYPLIEVPDELVFQYMMLGLNDYDYIVYNHRNKKICIGNNAWEVSSECSRDNPKPQNSGYSTKMCGGAVKGYQPSNMMFSFDDDDSSDDDAETQEREKFIKVIDVADGYQDFMNLIRPFVYNHFVKEVRLLTKYLSHSSIEIGRNTSDGHSEASPRAINSVQENRRFLQESLVPRDSITSIFVFYLNDDELIVNNKKALQEYGSLEILRIYTVDILTKFHENTQTKWDI